MKNIKKKIKKKEERNEKYKLLIKNKYIIYMINYEFVTITTFKMDFHNIFLNIKFHSLKKT